MVYVRFYTIAGTGVQDNTKLQKLVWEEEDRPAAARFPGKVQKCGVLRVTDLIKLEHIVPSWHDAAPGQKQRFYVNKYASYA